MFFSKKKKITKATPSVKAVSFAKAFEERLGQDPTTYILNKMAGGSDIGAIRNLFDIMAAEILHEYPDITVHLTLFNATIVEGAPQKLEHNDIQWISPAEISNYAFCPADEEILKKITEVCSCMLD